MLFTRGKNYKRAELHGEFGGQRQGGISTPQRYPFVFLFTGFSGKQYGYFDEWTKEGSFLYTGEGQVGDMNFTRGNAAIRDSIDRGKDLHMFQYMARGMVKYIGQMVCQGYQIKDGVDVNHQTRKVIVFELLPIDQVSVSPTTPLTSVDFSLPLDELKKKALAKSSETANTATRQVMIRERSEAIREYVLRRANGTCEGCNMPAPFKTPSKMPYLEPHHIRKLSDGGPDHPESVAALCPNCHARAHYSENRDEFNDLLDEIISVKESEL